MYWKMSLQDLKAITSHGKYSGEKSQKVGCSILLPLLNTQIFP